ncbi:hypothetical protein H5410_052280 [Solanum commersonii]|uniref:Uncharacterized protein n=1 Tax=Solanum commersonii TaxID=4109 RepID=A0A9J5X2J7_SOLCO|nr:hypothetical protein H5410_052280 [Solanum commersonii]
MPPKLGKPEKADALKQLGTHVALFGVWVAVIRITPYILNYFSDQKEEPAMSWPVKNAHLHKIRVAKLRVLK